MQSRRDQVQAYFYVVGRMTSAVTHGRPDVVRPPGRRLSTGFAIGVLIAAILCAGFGVYGLFKPGGNTSWRTAGAIVTEKTSGARFVYLNGSLHPVLNLASARLATGSAAAPMSVSAASLAGTPVGAPIGIPDAPDSVPAAASLNRSPWTVCASPPAGGTVGSPTLSLLLGAPAGPSPAEDEGLLVATPDGQESLVWQGRRYRLGGSGVAAALGYDDVAAAPVQPGWLAAVPAGPDLSAPAVDAPGAPGPSIAGKPSRVGQVYQVSNPALASEDLYLVRADGVAPLSRTMAALALSGSGSTVRVGPADIATVPRSAGPELGRDLPPVPPRLVVTHQDDVPCVRVDVADPDAPVRIGTLPAAAVAAATVPAGTHTPGLQADRIGIPAASGVLARVSAAPGAVPGAAFLVTDIGVRFPVADDEALTALGMQGSGIVAVPEQLLELLPTGPVLDRERALQTRAPQP
ncbi:type VII secretion protein EccB [Pseudonocardia sp. ICBG1122]|nr:type VII secretion protein EccB [Pseudonocardia pini]